MADQPGDARVLDLHDRRGRADADAVRLAAAGAVDVEALDVDNAAVHLARRVDQLQVASTTMVRRHRGGAADDDDVSPAHDPRLPDPPAGRVPDDVVAVVVEV